MGETPRKAPEQKPSSTVSSAFVVLPQTEQSEKLPTPEKEPETTTGQGSTAGKAKTRKKSPAKKGESGSESATKKEETGSRSSVKKVTKPKKAEVSPAEVSQVQSESTPPEELVNPKKDEPDPAPVTPPTPPDEVPPHKPVEWVYPVEQTGSWLGRNYLAVLVVPTAIALLAGILWLLIARVIWVARKIVGWLPTHPTPADQAQAAAVPTTPWYEIVMAVIGWTVLGVLVLIALVAIGKLIKKLSAGTTRPTLPALPALRRIGATVAIVALTGFIVWLWITYPPDIEYVTGWIIANMTVILLVIACLCVLSMLSLKVARNPEKGLKTITWVLLLAAGVMLLWNNQTLVRRTWDNLTQSQFGLRDFPTKPTAEPTIRNPQEVIARPGELSAPLKIPVGYRAKWEPSPRHQKITVIPDGDFTRAIDDNDEPGERHYVPTVTSLQFRSREAGPVLLKVTIVKER